MSRLTRRLLAKLSYANVVATLALVLAVGTGGAYAATQLARNSVGSKQLKRNAVTSSKVKNGSLAVGDLSRKARGKLRGATGPAGPAGAQGPAGVNEFQVVTNGGGFVGGGTAATASRNNNVYTITFKRPVATCAYTASLSSVRVPVSGGGSQVDEPPAGGTATVGDDGGSNVIVKTYDAAGNPAPSGFRVIVAC